MMNFQAVLNFIKDFAAFISLGALPGSDELQLMAELDEDPTLNIQARAEEMTSWMKVDLDRLLEYKHSKKQTHA